jgi:hypothetical protein
MLPWSASYELYYYSRYHLSVTFVQFMFSDVELWLAFLLDLFVPFLFDYTPKAAPHHMLDRNCLLCL